MRKLDELAEELQREASALEAEASGLDEQAQAAQRIHEDSVEKIDRALKTLRAISAKLA